MTPQFQGGKPTTSHERLRRMLLRHPDPEIRRWILLAYSPFLVDEPYLFPLDLLTEGMLVLAPTGSGKSSYFLDPLLNIVAHHDVSILSVNFKEGAASRENAWIAAKESGKKFLYFSTQCGNPSYCLNLIQSLMSADADEMTAMLRAEIATSGSGQNHGRGYGRSHFLSMTLATYAAILRPDLLPPGRQNFREVAKLLFEPRKLQLPGVFEEALKESAADTFMASLASSDLNVVNNQKGIDPGEHIDLDDFLKDGSNQLIYMELPYGSRPETAYLCFQTAIAKLTHALAKMPSTSKLKYLLIVDDAEPAFSPQFSQLLHVARSKGLGLVICIQGKHQAASGSDDFWESLQSYAATKVLLGVEDPDLFDYINETAGRVRRGRLNWKVPVQGDLTFGDFEPWGRMPADVYPHDSPSWNSPPLETLGVSMIEEARFEGNNEISLASARGDMAFIRVRKNSGPWQHHGRTIPVRLSHHITREEYEERSKAPPPVLPGSVTVTATDVLSDLFEKYGRRPGRIEETWKQRDSKQAFAHKRPRHDDDRGPQRNT